MRVSECVFCLVQGGWSMWLRGYACECRSACFVLYKADGQCGCEAMHASVGVRVLSCTRRMVSVIAARRWSMCGSVCLSLYHVYAHCNCCEARKACVGCVWAYAHCHSCEANNAQSCPRALARIIVILQMCMHT
jgi:hypothetical protein